MKPKVSKAVEHLFEAIGFGVMIGNIKKVPGAVIQKLSKKTREELSELKSDDVQKIRVEPWELEDEDYYERKKISEMKLEFDKLIKK